MWSLKSLWVPTNDLLNGEKFPSKRHMNESIGKIFWERLETRYTFVPVFSDVSDDEVWRKTFYFSFPENHGIDALWTGVQRFNATHFSERVSMIWSYVDADMLLQTQIVFTDIEVGNVRITVNSAPTFLPENFANIRSILATQYRW